MLSSPRFHLLVSSLKCFMHFSVFFLPRNVFFNIFSFPPITFICPVYHLSIQNGILSLHQKIVKKDFKAFWLFSLFWKQISIAFIPYAQKERYQWCIQGTFVSVHLIHILQLMVASVIVLDGIDEMLNNMKTSGQISEANLQCNNRWTVFFFKSVHMQPQLTYILLFLKLSAFGDSIRHSALHTKWNKATFLETCCSKFICRSPTYLLFLIAPCSRMLLLAKFLVKMHGLYTIVNELAYRWLHERFLLKTIKILLYSEIQWCCGSYLSFFLFVFEPLEFIFLLFSDL